MKLTLNVTTTLLIVFSLILTSLVLAQNPPKAIQVKGKPAKSTTVKMVTTRAVRRSSSAALMSVGAAAPVLPSVPSPLLQSHEPQYVPNQVLVKLESREETRARLNLINLQAAKLRNEALRADIQENVEATNITLALTRSIENPREGDLLVVNLPADTSPDKAITELRSEEHTSELQSRFGISYAVFCL